MRGIASFKNGEPRHYTGMGNSDIIAEALQIEKLPDHLDKTLELRQVFNCQQLVSDQHILCILKLNMSISIIF
jgi:hypothetical protein